MASPGLVGPGGMLYRAVGLLGQESINTKQEPKLSKPSEGAFQGSSGSGKDMPRSSGFPFPGRKY